MSGIRNMKGIVKYGFCVGAGVISFFLAEISEMQGETVENGVLHRNPCGKGDAVYEFYVDGVGDRRIEAAVTVPEQMLSPEEFHECVPMAAEILAERILGENSSLSEVRYDLKLVREIAEYGISVSWESKRPETISDMGLLGETAGMENGEEVVLCARLAAGDAWEEVEFPVTVLPVQKAKGEEFLQTLELLALKDRERGTVELPEEFDGQEVTYRRKGHGQNAALILLGAAAAACLYLKEQRDRQEAKKKREDSLVRDYSDLVTGLLILTGAGYSVKQAWRKLAADHGKEGGRPAYEEMQITLNQMETGTPERQAYAEFGRRCGIRCYMKLSSLLESCLSTGGKNLRALLEFEMEEAFKGRADLARRKGEEASTKLLIPMFGMLGIVMVMVVAPAFLSLG